MEGEGGGGPAERKEEQEEEETDCSHEKKEEEGEGERARRDTPAMQPKPDEDSFFRRIKEKKPMLYFCCLQFLTDHDSFH